MKTPSDSAAALLEYGEISDAELARTSPNEGFQAMFEFYRSVRSEYPLVDDSDMLLYEWGTYDFGDGLSFRVGLTRQFVEVNPDDEQGLMSQLHLTFHFPAALGFEFGRGQKWCETRSEVDGFAAFVRSSAPYLALAEAMPDRVDLSWEYV